MNKENNKPGENPSSVLMLGIKIAEYAIENYGKFSKFCTNMPDYFHKGPFDICKIQKTLLHCFSYVNMIQTLYEKKIEVCAFMKKHIEDNTVEMIEFILNGKLDIMEGKKINKNEMFEYLNSLVNTKMNLNMLKSYIEGDDKCSSLEEILECVQIEIPEYEIIRKLGKGAQGIVYKAILKDSKGYRAIKIFEKYNNSEPEIMDKYKERSLENIVAFHSVSDVTDNGVKKRALIMEYVDGQTLEEFIKANPNGTNIKTVLNYGSQICNGIYESINLGITHRDLKPTNIKINSRGKVKILDFGVASKDSNYPPNRAYTGPNIKNEKGELFEDSINDFFSLGLIMYELATGKHLISDRRILQTSESFKDQIARQKLVIYEQSFYDYENELLNPAFYVFYLKCINAPFIRIFTQKSKRRKLAEEFLQNAYFRYLSYSSWKGGKYKLNKECYDKILNLNNLYLSEIILLCLNLNPDKEEIMSKLHGMESLPPEKV